MGVQVSSIPQQISNLDDIDDVNTGTEAQGDIIYHSSTEWSKLGAGTAGQVLQTGGASANPSWIYDVPIGAIIAWAKSFTGVPALPSGWVECNGQVLSDADSLLNGQTIPNLNASRFLRGSTTSGTTGGAEEHSHTVPSNQNHASGALGGIDNQTTNSANHLPPYYEVVWIMKVK